MMLSMAKNRTALLLFLLAKSLIAEIKLAPIFSHNMVLQQGIEIPVWGWASPGDKIEVKLDQDLASTTADQHGQWRVKLPAKKYGGPFQMTVTGKNRLTLDNVMIGEVWICSGQSNMEFLLINSKNGKAEVAGSECSNIRLYSVNKKIAQSPLEPIENSGWQTCSPTTAAYFSAVAYYFGKALYNKLHVPIGLINASWGGTVAETWISRETMAKNPDFAGPLAQLDTLNLDDYVKSRENEIRARADCFSTVDLGMNGDQPLWAAPDYDDAAWKTMKLPGLVEQRGLEGFDGIIWFRKEIEISPADADRCATLSLARINDSDNTYVNGVLIGANKLIAEKSRVYTIRAGLLKSGKNILTVQVEDIGGNGGIYGDSAALKLTCGNRVIPLSGDWKYKVGLVKFNSILSPNASPTLLYNGMIHGLIQYAIRGATWYQGESNVDRAKQYQRVFPDLIRDWRNHWRQGDLPFLFVQVSSFMKPDSLPSESSWAELREAQCKALALPNTGMAVTIDVGDEVNIHPQDKQTVGNRLALAALKVAYKQDILFCGPVLRQMAVVGDTVILTFDHTGHGLKVRDKYGYLKGFAIAGEHREFYWAQAKLVSQNSVAVYCAQVRNPAALRYGWANNPEDANLYNSADLPASPFRTDHWPGITK